MDIVKELELYLSKHALESVVDGMVMECLRAKPEDPSHFLLKWLLQQNAGKASEEVAVASTADRAHVMLVHPDPLVQQYFRDKKLHIIFMELMKQVVEERPDNVLSFLALKAHQLHKAPPDTVTTP